MSKVMRAIGLMSGTSLDGIDVAYLETDGEDDVTRGPSLTFPYDDRMRELLTTAIADASRLTSRDQRPASLSRAELELTEHHASAVAQFLRKSGIERSAVDIIGFHGQTVLHKPEAGLTVQLGRGDMLANVTRCPVIYDLRAADVAAGGQGAYFLLSLRLSKLECHWNPQISNHQKFVHISNLKYSQRELHLWQKESEKKQIELLK